MVSFINRNCEWCNEPFKANVAEVNRGNGRFCGLSCSAKYRGKEAKTKAFSRRIRQEQDWPRIECDWCHKSFPRAPKLLRCKSKTGLKFCSRDCKDAAQRVTGLPELSPEHYGEGWLAIRTRMMEHAGCACQRCEYTEHPEITLEVHHRDRNRENNNLSNLGLLCAICHRIEHTNKEKLLLDGEEFRNFILGSARSQIRTTFTALADDLPPYPVRRSTYQLKPSKSSVQCSCQFCGAIFFAKPTQIRKGRGKFCSRECRNTASRKQVECICEYCTRSFNRCRSYVEKSKSGIFFCSVDCKNAAQWAFTGILFNSPNFINGDYAAYRRIGFFHTKEVKCQGCQFDRVPAILEVHHVDQNRGNNVPENLAVLCPICHKLTHAGLMEPVGFAPTTSSVR